MRCSSCGFENTEGVSYCGKCGQQLTAPYPTTPEAHKQRTIKERRKLTIVVASIIIVIMLIIAFLAFVPILSEKLVITVHSTHIAFTVHFEVYLDDELKAEGDLGPLQNEIISLTVNFPILSTGNNMVVTGEATGGGFGATTDQWIIYLQNGITEPLTLNI